MKIYLTLITLILYFNVWAQDSIEAKMTVAKEYFTGIGREKNKGLAMSLYLECANQGNIRAMNMVGFLYANGKGIEQNKVKAIEWLTKAGNAGFAESWYHLGMIYKDETEHIPDYIKAYSFIEKAAQLQNEMGIYSQGYMHYKGLGCSQDYFKASSLFKAAAQKGNVNSMYFLGLCYRNGYGVALNNDSAQFWLQKAADKGYMKARNELNVQSPENSNQEAARISAQLRKEINTVNNRANQYIRVEDKISPSLIEGKYTGYIIRYDWSGKYAINSSKLEINIMYKNGQLIGTWKESDTLIVPFQANLTPTEMIFKKTSYSRKDHYSYNMVVEYVFEKANLQWLRNGDFINIIGNIQMFSPKRNEPEKPLFISLTKCIVNSGNETSISLLTNETISDIRTYPSPFNQNITIEFFVKDKCSVVTQLLTLDGKEVYKNNAGILESGYYKLPVQPNNLAPGVYILKLQLGGQTKSTKVIKL